MGISLNINFLNAKTKKVEFEFQRYVRPTIFPQLSKATTEITGITQQKLDETNAQPLDEVLRELDRFLKEKSLVSVNRNKKKVSQLSSQQEQEFLIVTDCDLEGMLSAEMAFKKLNPQGFWKKYVDIKKAFNENYKANAANLQDMLQGICMEFDGVPH